MKKLLMSLLLLSFFNTAFSQEKLSYSGVITVGDSIPMSELFYAAKAWALSTFINAKDITQVLDKDQGIIEGKTYIDYVTEISPGFDALRGRIWFNFSIRTKDNKYKYEFTYFVHEGNKAMPGGAINMGLITTDQNCPYDFSDNRRYIDYAWTNKVWTEMKDLIDKRMGELVNSLKTQMALVKPVNSW